MVCFSLARFVFVVRSVLSQLGLLVLFDLLLVCSVYFCVFDLLICCPVCLFSSVSYLVLFSFGLRIGPGLRDDGSKRGLVRALYF